MKQKIKGTNAERELVHMFWGSDWACIRVAGSGSNKYPSPDLLAGNNLRKLAIECKCTKDDSVYLSKKEVDELRLFSSLFGAEAWIAVKFKEWFLINTEDLKETEKSFGINLERAESIGLSFNELIGKIEEEKNK